MTLMKLQILATLFAASAFGSTIAVTGSGSFDLSWDSTGANACFSGLNGTDSLWFCARGLPVGPAPPTLLIADTIHNALPFYSSATINGVQSNYWSLELGGYGAQFLDLLDASGNVLLSQTISGTIQITSDQQFGGSRYRDPVDQYVPNLEWAERGTFNIVSPGALDPIASPEAGSGILMGMGLGALMVGRNKKIN